MTSSSSQPHEPSQSHVDSAILAYAKRAGPTERPDLGYAMIFPAMTIVKILFVDIVAALFSKF